MARDTLHTKCRLCRREGSKLYLKGARCFSTKCPIEKKGAVAPGMHGQKRTQRLSAFGVQLRAKQKVKRYYGILEKQMHTVYQIAKKMPGMVGHNLLALLETRLDNFVYSSGLSLSRSHARQLVSHKGILVNGRVLNINSYQLKLNDIIEIKYPKRMAEVPLRAKDKDFKAPAWLELDRDKLAAKITRLPKREEIPVEFDENLIIEYYSR